MMIGLAGAIRAVQIVISPMIAGEIDDPKI